MLENSERSERWVRMGKSGPLERAELAKQIQAFRILDRLDASEKKKGIFIKFLLRNIKLYYAIVAIN